jgi:hypothetical protein
MLLAEILLVTTMANATEVCGDISGTWDSTGSPYYVTCNVVIYEGNTLSIQPGVEVLFNGNYQFVVLGSLYVEGSEQDSVLFSASPSNTNQRWWGIRVAQSAAYCSMNYCIVEHGWKSTGSTYDTHGGGLVCWNAITHVNHCTFRNNTAPYGGAVSLANNASTIANSLFVGNSANVAGAVQIGVDNSITRCTFYGNTTTGNGGSVELNGSGIISSCLISHYNEYAIYFGGVGAQARYCDFDGNILLEPSDIVPEGFSRLDQVNMRGDSCDPYHNIFLDPGFVNPDSGSYRLRLESRCIDAGDTSLPLDSDGTVADIGAFANIRPLGFRIIQPNGGELLPVLGNMMIQWTSARYTGAVSLAVNRVYPAGSWETIAQNTDNDGMELWTVSGPLSDHCRVRVSAVEDTLADMSDADFSIIGHLQLIHPNGGEQWNIGQPDTVRWAAEGITAVQLELNRNFPNGDWELLTESTLNDSSEVISFSGGPSDHCRIRITPVGGRNADTSDADFSLHSAAGYLGLVEGAAPDIAVTQWDAGLVESPIASPWYHLKNFGNTAIHVSPPAEPPSAEFSRTAGCNTYFTLSAGQMSACSLRVSFNPLSEGIYRDELSVRSDAVNALNDTVRFPLSGGWLSAPQSPQIAIRSVGNDIRLTWLPVTQTVTGYPVTISEYRVYASATAGGLYHYHGTTRSTTYIHENVLLEAGVQFYRVVAVVQLATTLDNSESGH